MQAERWRLFELKLSIDDDPGKDTHEASIALCSAVALKLKCKVRHTHCPKMLVRIVTVIGV